MLQGSINHVSITVSDLPAAMEFLAPLLAFMGYVVDRSDSTMVRINVSPRGRSVLVSEDDLTPQRR